MLEIKTVVVGDTDAGTFFRDDTSKDLLCNSRQDKSIGTFLLRRRPREHDSVPISHQPMSEIYRSHPGASPTIGASFLQKRIYVQVYPRE